MKTTKKITAFLIVLTLLFALSVTAYADDTYAIEFKVFDEQIEDWEVISNTGVSVYSAILSAFQNNAGFSTITGTSYHALVSLSGEVNGSFASYTAQPCSTAPAPYSAATPISGHPGYFEIETGVQGHHYLYAGYDWTYHYLGGGDLWLYMDQCFPASGSVIVVEYSLQITDWWTNTPII